jgi:ABC-type Fe3+/spermidine/putrescine transport system ATPase subunit
LKEVLSITNLSHSYNGSLALDRLSFSLGAGERLAVLGPSGSGKTTLLRLIAGLDAPGSGTIAILGRKVSGAGEVLIAPQHREVAMVFQGLALFPHLTALQQIAFAARGRGGIEQARALLEGIGLPHRASARLDQLSGGERQRVALARALAQEPKLILMDEPFASLDDEKRSEMRDLLRSLLDRRETALVLVTHCREDAFDLAQRVLVLDHGRLRGFGLTEELLSSPSHSAVVRTLGLGQLVRGEVVGPGEALTAFGKVAIPQRASSGKVLVLVRPGQPRIISGQDGVEVEVVSLGLRSPDLREVRRVAEVKTATEMLRLILRDYTPSVGQRIHIRIEGQCDVVEP